MQLSPFGKLSSLDYTYQHAYSIQLTAPTQNLVPSLIESIKVAGLVLVTDTSEDGQQVAAAQRAYRMPDGVDGILRGNGVLRFNEMIDM